MFKRHGFFLWAAIPFLSSCTQWNYIDQALALKAYAVERDALEKEVARRDAQFESLLGKIKSGQAQVSVKTAAELVRQFGSPILKSAVPGGKEGSVEWLYRYQLKPQGPKVYAAVGPDGRIKGFRFEK